MSVDFEWMSDLADDDMSVTHGDDESGDDQSHSSLADSHCQSQQQPRSLSQCSENSSLAPTAVSQTTEISSDEVLRRIEDFAARFIAELDDDDAPFPMLQSYIDPNDDDDYSTRPTKQIMKRFTALHQARSYTSIWLVLSFCHSLLRSNRTATNREVYYHYITHFRKQRECDAAILDAALLLQVPRMALGLKASPKGWFCGCLELVMVVPTTDDDPDNDDSDSSSSSRLDNILCDGRKLSSPNGFPITSEWLMGQRRRNFSLRATDDCICILVIEKEGVYNRLAEDRFFDEYPCILVCGKGFPDLATRACVYSLHKELDLPVWGVADCDPFGILVLHCYMYSGNTQLGVDGGSRYGVPIQWVGLRPSQVPHIATDGKELPDQCLMALTDKDCQILETILSREDHRWTDSGEDARRVQEIESMVEDGYKVELEAFNWMGMHYFSQWIGSIFAKHLEDKRRGEYDDRLDDDDKSSNSADNSWMHII